MENGDELLLELVAEATKELCGHSPTNEQVLAFLKKEELPPVRPTPPEPRKDRSKQLNIPDGRSYPRLQFWQIDDTYFENPEIINTFIRLPMEWRIRPSQKSERHFGGEQREFLTIV